MDNQKIVLATSSKFRRKVFEWLDLDFVAEASHAEEKFEGRPSGPEELCVFLAKKKAEVVAKNHDSGFIIGFDSLGCLEGDILEKPVDRKEAFDRLKRLAGNNYSWFTGIHIIDLNSGERLSRVSETKIELRDFSDAEIDKYLDQDEDVYSKGTGYDPQYFYSATFIKNIHGSYNNICRGIPVEVIIEMLLELGYEIE